MKTGRRGSGTLLKVGTAAIALSVMLLGGLNAARPDVVQADPPDTAGNDTREISPQFRKAQAPIKLADENGLPPKAKGDENRAPQVGDERVMIALDDARGVYYLKVFTLRATSLGAEVWVANNLNFPTENQIDPRSGTPFGYNDCRNDGIRNVVTDEQIAYMLEEFDQNIRPTDTEWFGQPLKRTGKNAVLDEILGTSPRAYFNGSGRDIILVDNVRDANYYDPNNASSFSYIAGFFTTAMPFYLDRNVITIDAFDWAHRTGADPLHQPSSDPCTSAPARPFLYEGVFAHEYQHLIHSDYDPDETNWVNEGLSDFAEILTGYSDPSKHINEKGNDSHTMNFLGWGAVSHPDWNPIPRDSGPENSLTVWEDQGPGEILGDYGHAYYFMTYLFSQGYDQSFFTNWAHNPLNGIDGLNDTLNSVGSSDTFASLFADMQTSALVDAFIDDGATVSGASSDDLQNDAANATVHFTPDAYDTPGAPPWGSDYIPLGLGSSLTSLEFDGDTEFFFPAGPQWLVDGNGYFAILDLTVDPDAIYGDLLDLSITHEVNLAPNSTLTFSHYYDMEELWDFGFVQISTDGGQTWESLACTNTTTDHDPSAHPTVTANLPGYTGIVGDDANPVSDSCDLSGYTGNAIIAFRFVSDWAFGQTGWFVKDVQINGANVGTPGDLAGWSNQKFYAPAPLDFAVRLVGLSGDVDQYGHVTNATSVVVVDIPLDASNDGAATAEQLGVLSGADEVVAIVSGVPAVEDNGIYGPYSLLANGVERADGSGVVNPW